MNDKEQKRFESRGRLLVIGDTQWRWKFSGVNIVAYSEKGERRFGTVRDLGISYDEFERGQWKKTSSGMIKPSDVRKWLESQ